jgi:DUF1680 family protein
VRIAEASGYPWSGGVRITVHPEAPQAFSLKLRVPGWAREASAKVNGEAIDMAGGLHNGYLDITRQWSPGDTVELDLPMPPERVFANPQVRMDLGRVTLRRGSLVYCLEQEDNPGAPVAQLALPRAADIEVAERRDLFDGIVTLSARGKATGAGDWNGKLYRTEPPSVKGAALTAIPYYLWANRTPGPMTVWVREI